MTARDHVDAITCRPFAVIRRGSQSVYCSEECALGKPELGWPFCPVMTTTRKRV
jgi:hypothetical protein